MGGLRKWALSAVLARSVAVKRGSKRPPKNRFRSAYDGGKPIAPRARSNRCGMAASARGPLGSVKLRLEPQWPHSVSSCVWSCITSTSRGAAHLPTRLLQRSEVVCSLSLLFVVRLPTQRHFSALMTNRTLFALICPKSESSHQDIVRTGFQAHSDRRTWIADLGSMRRTRSDIVRSS